MRENFKIKQGTPVSAEKEKYMNVATQKHAIETRLQELKNDKIDVETLHHDLEINHALHGDPDEEYPFLGEKKDRLLGIDAETKPLEREIKSLQRQLNRLYDKAWDEALIDNFRRNLELVLLPKIFSEYETIKEQVGRLHDDSKRERLVRELFNAIGVIVKELKRVPQIAKFGRSECEEISDLVKEFYELKKEVHNMHSSAFAPDTKNDR